MHRVGIRAEWGSLYNSLGRANSIVLYIACSVKSFNVLTRAVYARRLAAKQRRNKVELRNTLQTNCRAFAG